MNKKIYPLFVFIVLIVCAVLLMDGSEFLTRPVIKGSDFPWGTIITWFGLIALPASMYFGFNRNLYPSTKTLKILNRINLIIIFLASIWGFVSFYLANNWAFSFIEQTEFRGSVEAFGYFLAFTFIIVSGSLILFIIYLFTSFLKKFKNPR